MAQFVFDSHTHSNFSPDAHSNLDLMCQNAIDRGIDGFCVTDHCDVNHFGPGDWSSEEQLRQGLAAINRAKAQYAPKLMDEGEIRDVITATLSELGIDAPTAKDKGRIMKVLMPKVKGKADGKLVSETLGSFFQ